MISSEWIPKKSGSGACNPWYLKLFFRGERKNLLSPLFMSSYFRLCEVVYFVDLAELLKKGLYSPS